MREVLKRPEFIKQGPFREELVLNLVGRWPCRLPQQTSQAVLRWPAPRGIVTHGQTGVESEKAFTSIIIVTANGLEFSKMCLTSVLFHTTSPNYEIIIVDNCSSDGTAEFLHETAESNINIRLITNRSNRGFAAATNQGLARSRGSTLVLLNSDTIVPFHWLSLLKAHLAKPRVGLVGPVTNRCGNEAEVPCSYRRSHEFLQVAEQRRLSQPGRGFDIRMLSMFCLAMHREVYTQLGPLDERYGKGLYEDDDYSLRARKAGYSLVCAEDCLVHHFGQVSFGLTGSAEDYEQQLSRNRLRYEDKWEQRWKPHTRRCSPEYLQLRDEILRIAQERIPHGASVLVVSRGDEDLCRIPGLNGTHFPQTESGEYAGFYPSTSAECIEHLQSLQSRLASYIVFPEPALWWLEFYEEFGRHLDENYEFVVHKPGVVRIYRLK